MGNASIEKQVDTTVKLLLALLSEPRIKANELAKTLDVSTNYVARMISRFREAGLDIDYDFQKGQYVGKFTDQLAKTVLGTYSKKLRKVIREAEFSQPPVRFIDSLERYDLAQFAAKMGTSPQNIYNMIIDYKGQKLPAGWVAYQLAPAGKWFVVAMRKDRTGSKFELPDVVTTAHSYKVGEGDPVSIKSKAIACAVPKCGLPPVARGFCQTHYQADRRARQAG